MIARLSLASASLHDLTAGHTGPAAKSQHETLARAVEAHGVLVFANQAEVTALVQAARDIGTSPPGAKDRWLTVLTDLKKSNRLRCMTPPAAQRLGEVVDLNELRATWGGRAQVAVLPTSQATALGADKDGLLSDAKSSLEVAAAPIAAYCQTLRGIRELAEQGHLSRGALRDAFWRDVLMPIGRLSRHVTLLDRYLFTDLQWHNQNLPRSTRWAPEAVVWLLRKLDRVAPPSAQVILIGASGGNGVPENVHAVAQLLLDRWVPQLDGNLMRVEVAAGPWSQGGTTMPHDRHIRFSTGVGIKVHAGFGRLGRESVQDHDGMAWQYLWRPDAVRDLHRAEERVLEGKQTRRAVVLDRSEAPTG